MREGRVKNNSVFDIGARVNCVFIELECKRKNFVTKQGRTFISNIGFLFQKSIYLFN